MILKSIRLSINQTQLEEVSDNLNKGLGPDGRERGESEVLRLYPQKSQN